LDEATSAMDQESIDKMFECIDEYRKKGNDLTVICVIFRIKSYKRCDKIIVMNKDGSVAHSGTHDELMGNPDS